MRAAIAVVLLLIPRAVVAQAAAPPTDGSRVTVYVNVSGLAGSLARSRQFTGRSLTFGEIRESRARYPSPSRATQAPLLDLGGEVMVRPRLGVGVGYTRTTYEDTVALDETVPHPHFLNAAASAAAVTGRALERREAAVHVLVSLVPFQSGRSRIRLVAGPSFFLYSADMVATVTTAQTFDASTPQGAIAITGFTTEEAKAYGLGFHAGGEIDRFLTRVIGVGAGVRFSYGTVAVNDEPMSRLRQRIRVGGVLGFAGLRFRFGR